MKVNLLKQVGMVIKKECVSNSFTGTFFHELTTSSFTKIEVVEQEEITNNNNVL